MDTGKLLKIIEDIQKDEQTYAFQSKFQNILNFYGDNNVEGINNEKKAINEDLQKSMLGAYVMSDIAALEKIGASSFFGLESWFNLEAILNSQAHELRQKLEEFIQKRQDFINKFNAVKDTLSNIDLKPRILGDHEYEIGLSLPEKYSNLDNLKDLIQDVDRFFTYLAGEDKESKTFKIVSVSNGTIEFFISAAPHLASNFNIALDYILKVYGIIELCRNIKKGYEHYQGKRKTEIDIIHDAELEEQKEQLIVDFIDNVDTPKAEKGHLREFFTRIVVHFEFGVSAEVRTPFMESPRDPIIEDDEETKNKLIQSKKQFEIKQQIDNRNKEIFKLQKNNFYGMTANLPTAKVSRRNKEEKEEGEN